MTNYVEPLFGKDAFETRHEAEYIDRSDIEAFAICPLQGKLKKEHEGEIELHEPLPETGKIVHGIAEVAIKSNNFDLQEAADYIAEELPKARPDLQPEILRAGRHLANRLRWSRATQVLICEEQITRSLISESNTRGEILITTKPDLVLATNKPDTIIIIDYKSGWKERTNQQARDEFQTCVICWCLKAKYPHINEIIFRYWQTRTGDVAMAYIDLEAVVGGTKDLPLTQEDAFQARIFEAVKYYLDGNGEAWPSEAKCAWCDVAQWCKYAKEIVKDCKKDPVGFAANTLVLQEIVSRRLKVQNELVKSGRIIIGKDFIYDGSPKKKAGLRCSYKTVKAEKS